MSARRQKSAAVATVEQPLRCIMLVNPLSGFASSHTRNCSASIKIAKGEWRTCEEPGATRHAAVMSDSKSNGSEPRVMHCMNVCVDCAERLSDVDKGGEAIIHDAVYKERWEQSGQTD